MLQQLHDSQERNKRRRAEGCGVTEALETSYQGAVKKTTSQTTTKKSEVLFFPTFGVMTSVTPFHARSRPHQ
jgi:hypothetical protein